MRRVEKPIVLYDEYCNMCCFFKKWFGRLSLPGKDVEWRHYEEAAACGLNDKACGQALHIKLPDGQVLRGFYAVRRLSAYTWLCWLTPLFYVPGVPPLGVKLYAWVANNRYRMFGEKKRA
ncbi:UNVERIFIED_CONTAM: putative DCC family thiol-disulfide oxidoreductase YuxK [Brevibacillus sp. OAP136]|uniref:thiol-disulfide oxidoreductase DCC family protein n=1 Tax=Brevibacillus fluminis TaxID=511487 RepID=UPI001FE7ACD2|nr:DUF393 domain-containing protein [Brevibacillus fluminis]